MPIEADTTYALRLFLAAVLGALIGLEREIHDHPAGMRTHLLVSLGSAGFTVLSVAGFGPAQVDPSRVAAQIVTGIGFLGGGAILRSGAHIQGLTTAATIWVNAAVGMAAGAGEYMMASIATAITLVVLLLLLPLEQYLERHAQRRGPTE